MTFVVHAPASYPAERYYVLHIVLTHRLGFDWRLATHESPDVRIQLDEGSDERTVAVPDVLFRTAPGHWLTPAALPPLPLRRSQVGNDGAGVLDANEQLPVIYGPPRPPDGPTKLLEIDGHGARLGVDVFGSAFFMLTRYEEIALVNGRDRYDRFPAASSLAMREGFLRLPIVDAYVELLAAAIERLWPRLRRRRGSYQVMLTHDVDDPLSTFGRRPVQLARQFAGDLVRRRDPALGYRRARAIVSARRANYDPDPHNTFDFLMDVSERHGLRSAFYFLAHNDVDPRARPYHLFDHLWVRRLLGDVHRRGHEVGLHAGFDTYRDPARTAEEWARLREIAAGQGIEQERWGGRQHYLQWANPVTWRNWSDAGLSYDCTLAFSEEVGFRTGTCHDYPVFDLLERRALPLVEKPFQIMDVTLFKYLALRPDAALGASLRIARECRRFQGTLGILWHNDEVLRTAREKRWYESLVSSVVDVAA